MYVFMNVSIYVGVNTFDLKLILQINDNHTVCVPAGGVCRWVRFSHVLTQTPAFSALQK